MAELELLRVKVEVDEPAEQLPRDCDAEISIVGQSTAEEVDSCVYVPVKVLEVLEISYCHWIVEPWGTETDVVSDEFIPTLWFVTAFWKLPPLIEYWTLK